MKRIRRAIGVASLFGVLCLTGLVPRAQSSLQVLLEETFSGSGAASDVLLLNTGAEGFPCLTADLAGAPTASTIPNCHLVAPDAAGQGKLRFTAAVEQQASGFVAATSLPTSQGLTITFKQYQYGGYGLDGPGSPGGADGIAIFLAVAPPAPQTIGPQGGALGYAAAGSAGLPGGWLGIGLDAFGNYSNPSFGGVNCPVPTWAGFNPDSVTVRGPGHGTEGYCLLASSADQTLADGLTLRGDDRAASERTITIAITPDDGLFRVFVDSGSGAVLATSGALPASYYDPSSGALVDGLPPRITFGFSASTGSATDIHEISDLVVTTAGGNVPVLQLTKTNSTGNTATPGESFNYQITPAIGSGAAEADPLSIVVSDTLPAGLTVNGGVGGPSWNCSVTSATTLMCAYTDASAIPAGTTLPSITVPVLLAANASVGAALTNTASVLSSDAAQPVEASSTVAVVAPIAPLTITTTSLPGGTAGVAYSRTLAASGGAGARTWSLAAGPLPSGISLASNGALSGTTTSAGSFPFTARVTDSTGSATKDLTLSIAAAPLTIATTTLPGASVGVPYTATLSATGGVTPRSWSLATGPLPAGLSLSTAGVISGTPTTVQTLAFTVRLTDAAGTVVTAALSIVVTRLTIATTALPAGRVQQPYSVQLTASGATGAVTWTLDSGVLPAGLGLSTSGVISGLPTTPELQRVFVRVTDAAGRTATHGFNLRIQPPPLAITTTALPIGEVAVPYQFALAATGGATPYTWSLASGTLPLGLTLSPLGVVAGTPTIAGTAVFVARVTGAGGGTVTRRLTLQIVPRLAIPAVTLPGGFVGGGYSATLATTGGSGAVTWARTAGTLPPGLTLSAAGALGGSPTTAGAFSFTVRAIDALGGRATRALTIVVTEPRPEKVYRARSASRSSCPFLDRPGCFTEVAVVDVSRQTVVGRIPYEQREIIISLTASADGTRVFSTSQLDFGEGRLRVIDTATDTVILSQAVPGLARVFISPLPNTIYLVSSSDVAMLDSRTLAVRARRIFTGTPSDFAVTISPTGNRVYTFLRGVSGTTTELISMNQNLQTVSTLDLGATLVGASAVTPDGRRLLAASSSAPQTSVLDIDLASNTVTRRIPGNVNRIVIADNRRGYLPTPTGILELSLVTNTIVPIPGAPGLYSAVLDPSRSALYGRGIDATGRLEEVVKFDLTTHVVTVLGDIGVPTLITNWDLTVAKGQ